MLPVKRNLRRSESWFGQILIVLLIVATISTINSLPQKFHFPIEVMLNSLQIQKGLELVFRRQFL